jgi:hypothetical protein
VNSASEISGPPVMGLMLITPSFAFAGIVIVRLNVPLTSGGPDLPSVSRVSCPLP